MADLNTYSKFCPNCNESKDFLHITTNIYGCTVCDNTYEDQRLKEAFLTARRNTFTPNFDLTETFLNGDTNEYVKGTFIKDSEKGALKFDTDKPQMELLDPYAMEQIAAVMTFGAKMYSAQNWRQGFKFSRIIGASFRHLSAYTRGEDLDPESGLSHLAHLGCCVMFLIWHSKFKKELDDRYVSK